MSCEWKTSGESLDPNLGPYAHWWTDKERPHMSEELFERGEAQLRLDFASRTGGHVGRKTADAFYSGGAAVPLPQGTANDAELRDWDTELTKQNLPEVPNDTVLVGIVDTGISLSNSRFRTAEGRTRFISSWQQSAPFAGQLDLPCGQELYACDIQEKLDTYGSAGRLGYVDEVAFNRDLNLTEPLKSGGQRDLEMAAAHGTHVLDLAAGLDPDGDFPDLANRLRMLAVNLPAQYAHGTAGGFLAYFASYAVERIIHVADALWARNNPDDKTGGGYPLIINFSYGMTAGPKDGRHIFEEAIRDILNERDARLGTRAAPVRLILPAGNDNLKRCAASAILGKDGEAHEDTGYPAQSELTLPWRVLPADSTANFVEVWFEAQSDAANQVLVDGLQVSITPPNATEAQLQSIACGTYQDLGDFARVYVDITAAGEASRLALLICVAPTAQDMAAGPVAPAGLWSIKILHNGTPVDTAFYIQSDQSAVRTSRTGRRSYFDDEAYKTHLENGAIADTYSYEPDLGEVTDNDSWTSSGPVQRRGTHNALVSIKSEGSSGNIVAIGGFDDSNGYPAAYSSSTDGNSTKQNGRASISATYPSENGASLYGLLAAGARDGSVTAYRGTSMATALATREAALAFLTTQGAGDHLGTECWFKQLATLTEREAVLGQMADHWGQHLGWPRSMIHKSGAGRIKTPAVDRKWRRLGGTD